MGVANDHYSTGDRDMWTIYEGNLVLNKNSKIRDQFQSRINKEYEKAVEKWSEWQFNN